MQDDVTDAVSKPITEDTPASKPRGQAFSDAFYFGVLGIWIGGYAVMGLAAGVVFRASRELKASIGVPPWDQPQMAELAQADVLAGYQFGQIFGVTTGLMTVLAMLMLAAYGIRFTRGHWTGFGRWGAGLVLLIAVLFFGVSRFQGRQVFEARAMYYHAVETQKDNVAEMKHRFDELHAASSSSGKAALAALAVLFVVSVIPGKEGGQGGARFG